MTTPTTQQEQAEQSVEYTSLTPSGIEVAYQPKPRRLYKIRSSPNLRGCGGDCGNCQSPCGPEEDPCAVWQEVPSVTTVLDILSKDGLPWWGMKVGIEGVIELARRAILVPADFHRDWLDDPRWQEDGWTVDEIVSVLTREKLTVNHVRDQAGDRGTAVHSVLEHWADTGRFPDRDLWPAEQAGYIAGLQQFLSHLPSAEPVASEVMVGSLEHQFAGRYDIRFKTSEPHQIVRHRTPKRGPQWATLKPGLFLADLKTSSGVYTTHHLQLAAYELASIECGYGATEAQGIIRVGADGSYVFTRSKASGEHFLAVRKAYDAIRSIG